MSEKFVPFYDIDVANQALSMGWKHELVYGDHGSHENAVRHIQMRLGLSWEECCRLYRQELAWDIHFFFTKVLGPRK